MLIRVATSRRLSNKVPSGFISSPERPRQPDECVSYVLQNRVELSKPERVLHLSGEACVSRSKTKSAEFILEPTLVENQKNLVARLDDPANPALPAQIP